MQYVTTLLPGGVREYRDMCRRDDASKLCSAEAKVIEFAVLVVHTKRGEGGQAWCSIKKKQLMASQHSSPAYRHL